MRKKVAVPTVMVGIVSASLVLFAVPSVADDKPLGVPATFGVGLNTAQPGNAVNHKILPKEIKVNSGGVVNFTVAGFHDIIVFKPGTNLADLFDPATGQLPLFGPGGTFVFDPVGALPANIAARVYYRGINPAGGPLLTAVAGNPANGSNRNESVGFFTPGTYLVICNIRPHLLDGMMANVKVDD